MNGAVVSTLRAGVALALLAGLFGQAVVIPTTAADEVDRFPPYGPYELPYVTVAVLGVACVQVALVATWVLLGMVRRDALFTPRAFRWVDMIIGASAAATLLALGVTGHLLVADIPSPDDGMELLGALFTAAAGTGVGAGFALLVVVMRGLLHKATHLQTELAGVV
ncbi:DUF2975 domain-containing protein [Streptomyces sp. NPDC054784]